MTHIDRRAAAPLLAIDDEDVLIDTVIYLIAGLTVSARRRLLNRIRMAEQRAQNAHAAPTQRPQDAHKSDGPRTKRPPGAHETPTQRPRDAHETPTQRPRDAHETPTDVGAGHASPSDSAVVSGLSETTSSQKPSEIPERAGARGSVQLDLADGAHPEDADCRAFARGANAAHDKAGRVHVFPNLHVPFSDQRRIREAWPRLHAAASTRAQSIEAYVADGLAAFLARSKRGTWVLWLIDPVPATAAMPAPRAAVVGDDSDEGIDKALGI